MGVEADGKKQENWKFNKTGIQETGYSTKLEIHQVALSVKSGNQGFQASHITRKPYHKASGVAVLGNTRCLHGAVLQKSRMAIFVPSLGLQLLDFRNSAKHKWFSYSLGISSAVLQKSRMAMMGCSRLVFQLHF